MLYLKNICAGAGFFTAEGVSVPSVKSLYGTNVACAQSSRGSVARTPYVTSLRQSASARSFTARFPLWYGPMSMIGVPISDVAGSMSNA